MSHTRKDDQAVEAFSASKALIGEAKRKASELGMTKSGFFRYCLAKELGYPEKEARFVAAHRSVQQLRESVSTNYPAHRPDNYLLNEKAKPKSKPNLGKSPSEKVAEAVEDSVGKKRVK